jgi:acetylornithine deacetylase/succinyl-diaminopimelate desuccinylase-like protein
VENRFTATEQVKEWLSKQLGGIGFKPQVLPTAGHPVVYGESLNAPGKPTVLVYGHYDVQPVDPLNEWVSPPFEPTVRGDNISRAAHRTTKVRCMASSKRWKRG